jgi:TonB family protein
MLSLNDLRSPAVALDWHEAVAVAAALAGLVLDAQADACPAPGSVRLLPSGDLSVSGPDILAGPPAAGAAQVLGQLLDLAPCPAELRQLAATYAADARRGPDGQDALVSFLASLAFFERPGRQAVLAAVATRAEPALDRARRAAALDALTERTRLAAGGDAIPASAPPVVEPSPVAPPDAVAASPVWEPRGDDGFRRLVLPAAVSFAVFLGMAYLAAAWLTPRPPAAHAAPEEEDLPVSGPEGAPATTAAAPRPARQSASSPARPPAARGGAAPPAAGPPVAASGAGPAPAPAAPVPGATASPVAAPPPTRSVDVTLAERDGGVVASPIAPVRTAPRPSAVPGRVFTASDPQVTPAILIRPKLPDRPPADVPEEQVGTLEFVVSESGLVEHVHLVSPANRYSERMLVAAAKTWQFQPATRDGRPVRFRTRIRVTL